MAVRNQDEVGVLVLFAQHAHVLSELDSTQGAERRTRRRPLQKITSGVGEARRSGFRGCRNVGWGGVQRGWINGKQ